MGVYTYIQAHTCKHTAKYASINVFIMLSASVTCLQGKNMFLNKWMKENVIPLWMSINWYFVSYHRERFLSVISIHVSPESVPEEKITSAQRLRINILHFHTSEAIYILFSIANSISLYLWHSSSHKLVSFNTCYPALMDAFYVSCWKSKHLKLIHNSTREKHSS